MPATHSHGHDVGERLLVHRHSPMHRLPAEVKIVALVAFAFTVVMTPPTALWAFAAFAALLVAVAVIAQLPARVIVPRMAIEIPFVLFALLMPFFGTGATVEVGPLTLYEAGLVAGWGILVKATLGVFAAIILAATTPARDLIRGLERLHLPTVIVQIAAFMLRYIHVVGDEMHRMRLARESRGFTARGVRAWPVLAQSMGTLFIRSYERGERVHLAMLSRGYTGRLPELDTQTTTAGDWAQALLLPVAGLTVALTALALQ